jgi:hypothetical protein
MYCSNDRGLWVNLYGGNRLETQLSGGVLGLDETTDYPWNGRVEWTIRQAPADAFSIFLRIPGWCDKASLTVNGKPVATPLYPGSYAEIRRVWKTGDVLKLVLPMRTELIEANPLVEETRGQVAVRRGPIIYCLESPDLPAGESIFDVALPWKADLQPTPMVIGKSRLMALEGKAWLMPAQKGRLYEPVSQARPKEIPIRMIPYYSWANRGRSDMTVWIEALPLR